MIDRGRREGEINREVGRESEIERWGQTRREKGGGTQREKLREREKQKRDMVLKLSDFVRNI